MILLSLRTDYKSSYVIKQQAGRLEILLEG